MLIAGSVGSLLRSRSSTAFVFLAAAVAALALFVRSHHITAPPFDFHPDRQFHSFIIARAYYLKISSSAPAWERSVANANLRGSDSPIEPPIAESITAAAYRITGSVHLWIPRLFSSLFWITGGLLLYLLATRFASRAAALCSVVVYLFLPFPLVASTSFQPDSLMVMMLIGAML